MDIQPKKDNFWAYQSVEPEEVAENIKKVDSDSWTFDDMIASGVPLDSSLIRRPPTKLDDLKRKIETMGIIFDNEVIGNFEDFESNVSCLMRDYSEFFNDGELEELKEACDVVETAFDNLVEKTKTVKEKVDTLK